MFCFFNFSIVIFILNSTLLPLFLGIVALYLVAHVIEDHKKPNPIAKVRLSVGFLILVDVDENELEACRGQSTCQMYWFNPHCVNRH